MRSLGHTGVGRLSSWSITHSFPRLPVLDDLLNNSNYPATDRRTDETLLRGSADVWTKETREGREGMREWLREQSSDSGGKYWLTQDKSLSVRISARPLAKSSSRVVLHPVCVRQMCPVLVSGVSQVLLIVNLFSQVTKYTVELVARHHGVYHDEF